MRARLSPLILALTLAGCDELAAFVGDAEPPDRLDLGVERPQDLGPRTDGAPDARIGADLGPDAEPPPAPDPCGRGLDPDPDRPRFALVAHPFGEAEGRRGHTLASYPLDATGRLSLPVDRLDLGQRVIRLRFLPSGRFAVALDEASSLSLLAVAEDGALRLVERILLPGGGPADLVVDPDGAFVHVINRDVGADAGIHTVAIGCGGSLEPLAEPYPLRLVHALTLLPGDPDRALVIGGQAVFEPVDDADTRLVARRPDGGWAEVAAYDLWDDFIDLTGVGIDPSGRFALVPNGSEFSDAGGQVMLVDLSGDSPRDAARYAGMTDARQSRFHRDGTALVSRLQPGRVTVFLEEGAGPAPVDELRYGLPEDLAILGRGRLDGLVVLPAISAQTGSQLVTLRIVSPGVVQEVQVLALPEGLEWIPGSVAVAP